MTRGRILRGLAALAAALWTGIAPAREPAAPSAYEQRLAAAQAAPAFTFEEIGAEAFDRANLTPRAQAALRLDGLRWSHAQTKHFVLHYERKIFALKVARLAEFLYEHMHAELGHPVPRLSGRNHIFVFRSADKWQTFMTQVGLQVEWAFSAVEGPVMYLQRATDRDDSLGVLAHEITHIVLFRLLGQPPPLWLNEGLAQWYEEFGYAAYKGTRKSWRNVFRGRRGNMPLAQLFALNTYPEDPNEIRAYYEAAKYLTGLLMARFPPEQMQTFLTDVCAGLSLPDAFKQHYGFENLEALERDFERFGR